MDETITYWLRVKDQLSGPISRAEGGFNKLKVGVTAAGAAISAAMGAAAVASVNMASDFGRGMATIQTLIPSQVTRVEELSDAILDLSTDVGKSTEDLTDGLYNVISAFGDTADTVAILEINAKAAKAGLAETTDAINLTSAVTKGYGDTSAEAVQKVADLAFQAVKLGQTTFPDLASSMGKVVPLAAELKVSQEELFGVMATATGVTGNAKEVATQLRGAFQGLLSPTADMTKLLEAQGYASGQAMIDNLGLKDAIQLVVDHASNSGEPLQNYISSIDGQVLALALAGPQSEVFAEKLDAVGNAAGSASEAYTEMTTGMGAAGHTWDQLTATTKALGIELGMVLLPYFLAAVETVRNGLSWFQQLDDRWKSTIVVVGGIVGVLGALIPALQAMLFMAPALKLFWATAFGPISIAAAAIIGLGTLVWSFRDEIVNAFRAVAGFIQPWVNRWLVTVEAIVGWIPGVGEKLSGMVATARTQFDEFANGVEPAAEALDQADGAAERMNEALTGAPTGEGTGGSVAALNATKVAAKEVTEVYTADLIPAISMSDTAVVDAHINIRKLVAANKQELIPSNDDVAMTFIQNQIDMADVTESEQQRIEDDARATAEAYQQIWIDAFNSVEGLLGALKQTIAKSVFDSDMFAALHGRASTLGEKLGSKFGSSMGQTFSGLFSGLASGGISAAIDLGIKGLTALGKKLWGGLKRMFGGPSEATVAARESLEAYAATIEADELNKERLNDWIAGGFRPDHAKIVTYFQDMALSAGASAQVGVDAWLAYQAAIEAGDQTRAQAIIDQVDGWAQAGVAAEEAAEAAATAEAERLAQSIAMEEERRDASLTAIKERFDAEMSMLKEQQSEALSVMRETQEAELAQLKSQRDAQLSVIEQAIQRELEDEKIAAQLQIDIEKARGDEEAILKAKQRADEAYERLQERDQLAEMMKEAEERVRARYQDELDAINEHWDKKEAVVVERHELETQELETQHKNEQAMLEASHHKEMKAEEAHWAAVLEGLRNNNTAQITEAKAGADGVVAAITSSLSTLPARRTVEVITRHISEYSSVGSPPAPYGGERAYGGPVSRGMAYLVGERGPELIVPKTNGNVLPNGVTIDTKQLAKEFADELRRNPITAVVPRTSITRTLMEDGRRDIRRITG